MLETVPGYLSESPGLLYSSSRSSPIFSIASPNPVLTLIIFYEKSAERGICGICCYLIELSHDKAKLSQHVIQILINFRHSKPREDYQNHLYNILFTCWSAPPPGCPCCPGSCCSCWRTPQLMFLPDKTLDMTLTQDLQKTPTFSKMLIELESWPYMMPICLQTCPMSFSTLLVRVLRASVWLERMVRVIVSNLAARLSSISPPESSMSSETCGGHSRLVFLQIPGLRSHHSPLTLKIIC